MPLVAGRGDTVVTRSGRARWVPQLAFALVLLAVMGLVQVLPGELAVFEPARVSLGYGFLLLVSFICGELCARVGLPRLSGYILTGMLCGPYGLAFVDAALAQRMGLIDDLALTFIALTAGAELQWAVLRKRARAIGCIILSGTLITFGGTVLLIWALREVLPFTRGLAAAEVLTIGAVVGAIAVARSPTSAIAIIRECRAKGNFTDTVFGVTVAIDSLVILLFALVLSFGAAAVLPDQGVNAVFIAMVFAELFASVVAGIIIGSLIAHYIRSVRKDLIVVLVVLSFLITYASHWVSHAAELRFGASFHLEPLLIATVAGFVVQNFSSGGDKLVQSLHAVSLPIFVVFFSMAGVGLDLGALAHSWVLALVLVAARMVLLSGSSYLGCAVAGESPPFSRLCGLAFFTQAGVSIGLAQVIEGRFPTWGGAVETFLIACIAVNQVLGPLTFKYALDRIGDSGRA